MSKKLFTAKLAESGLSSVDAKRLGIRYVPAPEAARLTARHGAGFNQPSLLIPYFEPSGKRNCFWRLRRLEFPTGKTFRKKQQKYTQTLDAPPRAYFPPLVPWDEIIADPSAPIFITEGELKAACATARTRLPVLALGGVWNWTSRKYEQPLIPDLARVAWTGRAAYLAFDSDARSNPDVMRALVALAKKLTDLGAMVYIITLPDVVENGKTGLDDYIVAKGPEAFEDLVDTAEAFALAGALWDLNRRVVWVRHPTMVIESATRSVMSVQQFRDNYAPFKFLRETSDGKLKEVSAAKAWIEWPSRLEVHSIDYHPGGGDFVTGADGFVRYNTWRGWGVDPVPGDVTPWDELLAYVFDGEPAHRRWFESWAAYQFQNPGAKMYSAVIAEGAVHGTGKSLIGMTLRAIFGDNGTVIDQKQLTSNYNKWAENKQFIIGDEITGIEKRKEADYIKTLITREEMEINAKFMPTYTIRDRANWYLTTNHADAFIIEDHDRRFFVWRFPSQPLPREFYARYDAWLRGSGPGHLFEYLLRYPIDPSFDPKGSPPVTYAKREMIDLGKNDLELWAAELAADPDAILRLDNAPIKGDLFTTRQLAEIAEASGIRVVSLNGVSRALTKAGFPAATPVRTATGTRRLRAVRDIAKWLKAGPDAWADAWDKRFAEKRKKY